MSVYSPRYTALYLNLERSINAAIRTSYGTVKCSEKINGVPENITAICNLLANDYRLVGWKTVTVVYDPVLSEVRAYLSLV